MSRADDLGLPIIEEVNGEPVEFHRLTIDDIERWANDIAARRKADGRKRIAANKSLSPVQQAQMLQWLENEDIEYADVVKRSYTPVGIRRVLITSLTKSGRDDDAAVKIVTAIHHERSATLAREIMSPPRPEVVALAAVEAGKAENPPEGDDAAETSSPTVPC